MTDGFQYFPAVEPADSIDYAAGVDLMTDWVIQVTKDISTRYKIKGSKFWVIGFSQGGAAAHLMGLFRSEVVAGYAALGGYLIDRFATSERFEKMKRNGVNVFVGHGSQDQVVTPDEAEKARDRLQDYEINVSYHTYAAGHTIPPELRQDLTTWLQQQIFKPSTN
jgi:phospholipase/carboxylesterase